MSGVYLRSAFAGIFVLIPLSGFAQTATDTFEVRITIAEECQIISTQTLDFGSTGVLTTDVDGSAQLQVACTNTTPYDVGLDAGLGAGATTTTRLMTSGAATVAYALFRDAARSSNWGDTVGTNTQAGIGTGTTQNYTVYGRVSPQTTPAPGTYTDTVTVTVTY